MDWSSTLKKLAIEGALDSSNIGLEREALRFNKDGKISQSSHPKKLGSALCHSSITTDFSEALLELVSQYLKKVLI